MKRRLLSLVFAAAAISSCAQSSPRPDMPAPAAQIAPLEYRSAFAGYQSFRDEPIAPWRGANETVKEAADDHRGHR